MRTIFLKHKLTGHKNTILIEENIPDFILEEYDVYDSEPDIPEPTEPPQETLEEAKRAKKAEIFEAFKNQFSEGLYSYTLQTTIDCRRLPFQKQDDYSNVKVLRDFMFKNSIPTTYYRDFFNNNIPNVTIEMLDNVLKEMEEYGIGQYMKKHQLDDAIKNATTIEEVKTIAW